jgi:tryptophan synthase alpha chain
MSDAVGTNGRKRLVIYLMAGEETPELAAAALKGGADIIELGFPFSDPLADGPVIRQAAEAALAAGMTTPKCLDCVRAVRELTDAPIVPMTYAALFEAYGWDALASDVRKSGATSMIVADVPVDARPKLRRVQLVAPTSTDERIRIGADTTDGWLYLVTLTGTTGVRSKLASGFSDLVKRTRAVTSVPLYAGFGISEPEHARAAAELADGVIVGSRALLVARDGPAALSEYVASLREALDG